MRLMVHVTSLLMKLRLTMNHDRSRAQRMCHVFDDSDRMRRDEPAALQRT